MSLRSSVDYGPHYLLWRPVCGALIGVVGFGTSTGSMLPFILRRLGFDPPNRIGAVCRHAGRMSQVVHLHSWWRS